MEVPVFETHPQQAKDAKRNLKAIGTLEKIEYKDGEGFLSYYKQFPFPLRGLMFDEVVLAIVIPKRLVIGGLKVVTGIGRGFFKNLCRQFNYIAGWQLQEYKLLPNAYSKSIQELYSKAFLWVEDEVYRETIRVLAMILEFDAAYRYRAQDAFGLLNKESFKRNPAKEVWRICTLCAGREEMWLNNGNTDPMKWKLVGRGLWWILTLSHKARKYAIIYIESLDLEKVALDDLDWQFCARTQGYGFGGLTLHERLDKINGSNKSKRLEPTV